MADSWFYSNKDIYGCQLMYNHSWHNSGNQATCTVCMDMQLEG